MIAWADRSTEVLLNPRLPERDARRVHDLIATAPALEAHVWLTTSGSSGRLKPVALAKTALLASAEAVNRHLESTGQDVWLNPLPAFHVGGLGIHARAHLSGAAVETLEVWDTGAFRRTIEARRVTLTSLVPTQVFDLVQAAADAPPSLRAVVVGGGMLRPELLARGRALGWPLLPSYGATECASQIATAPLPGPDLDGTLPLLPHVDARIEVDGRLAVRSAALFTGYATDHGLDDPKQDGWWITEDLAALDGRSLTVRGRADETVKVGGELVYLTALDALLAAVVADTAPGLDAALVGTTDPRLGSVVTLVVAAADDALGARVRDAFNERVLPFERIRSVRRVSAIPRTALGKVARAELWRRLGA